MRFLLLTITLLLCNLCAHAQSITYLPLPNQEQLPVANVNVILQDHEGYMWYGTAGGGLCCDDGYHITTYNSQGKGKGLMTSNEITCLAEDQEGKIWFGTRAGVFFLDKKKNRVHKVDEEHVKAKKTNCIGVTDDGHVWVGVQQHVIKFSPSGKVQKVLSIGNNKREEVKEMTLDSKGTLWLTILRGGLATINPKTDQLTHREWTYPYAASYVLEDTLHHCYWVGTWGGGIVKYPDMTPETATIVTTEKQRFGSEIHNMQLDVQNGILWAATMDDVYAYRIVKEPTENGRQTFHLIRHATSCYVPAGKKLINKLCSDRKGNIWVPGYSPHTFILSYSPNNKPIYRDEVPSMTQQMGYKIMVNGIAPEDGFFWIYQNRTRLSLYNPATGQLAFMANEAVPTPLSTQKSLSRCKAQKGVWTCNGKKLIHAWNEGMIIHWEEVKEALMPNYISALSDEGNGQLLIGTEKQVFLYNYHKKTVTKLTDSIGIVQQVGHLRCRHWANGQWRKTKNNVAAYTLDPKASKTIIDTYGHEWTLNELTITERSPKTGAYRTLSASDPSIHMDYFTDITLTGDSICIGGIGAFCLIGSCKALDKKQPDVPIIVTRYDTLQSISISTMDHLHAPIIQYAYRIDTSQEWNKLPVGENTITITDAGYGSHTLYARATDEFGVWHHAQEVFHFEIPRPWWLQWWAWCIYTAAVLALAGGITQWFIRTRNINARALAHAMPDDVSVTTATVLSSATEEKDPFLQQVEALVQKNLDNNAYDVNELSRDLGMSRMNMYRKFRCHSNLTPSDYIKHYRLTKAMELLTSSTASITEIAYKVGFTSPQYFAKCFKDEYNCSPRQYRDEAKGET